MGTHSLLQEIFLTQGSNPGLLPFRQILYHLSHQGSPRLYMYASMCSKVWSLSVECWVLCETYPVPNPGLFLGKTESWVRQVFQGLSVDWEDDKWVISISTVWYHGSDGENWKEEQASLMEEVTLSWDLEDEQEISLAEEGWPRGGKNSSFSQKWACHLQGLQTVQGGLEHRPGCRLHGQSGWWRDRGPNHTGTPLTDLDYVLWGTI